MLMILPSVPAVEYNTAIESNKSALFEKIQNMDIKELKEKIKNIDIEKLKDKFKDGNGNSPILGLITLLLKWLIAITAIVCPFKIIPSFLAFIFYIYLLIFWH